MGALWTFLRACGIVVGIATLLRLATIGFNVEFNDLFQAFLDRMRAFFELDAVIDVIEAWLVLPALAWLRRFDLPIPDLADHWRPLFTLTWLLLAAVARRWRGNIVANVVWAFVCALLAAVAAGTQSLAGLAVVAWPLAAFGLFYAGLAVLYGDFKLSLPFLGIATALGAWGFFDTRSIKPIFGLVNASPTLLFSVGFVGLGGLIFLAFGLLFTRGTWRERLAHYETGIGLDIWGVMGGALAIGYLMLK